MLLVQVLLAVPPAGPLGAGVQRGAAAGQVVPALPGLGSLGGRVLGLPRHPLHRSCTARLGWPQCCMQCASAPATVLCAVCSGPGHSVLCSVLRSRPQCCVQCAPAPATVLCAVCSGPATVLCAVCSGPRHSVVCSVVRSRPQFCVHCAPYPATVLCAVCSGPGHLPAVHDTKDYRQRKLVIDTFGWLSFKDWFQVSIARNLSF